MEKQINTISKHLIEVEFPDTTTSQDIRELLDSCKNGSCGCEIDPEKAFESFQLSETSPHILFTVKPEERDSIIKRLESCTCTPGGKEPGESNSPCC